MVYRSDTDSLASIAGVVEGGAEGIYCSDLVDERASLRSIEAGNSGDAKHLRAYSSSVLERGSSVTISLILPSDKTRM